MISPSAPAAIAARAMGATLSRMPVPCDGIDDHRQVRELLHHRDGVQVERVARVGLERADAALAQDHLLRCPAP
jgi:hypothetical protein